MIKLVGIAIFLFCFAVAAYFLFVSKSKHPDFEIREKRNRQRKIFSSSFIGLLAVMAYFMFFFRTGGKELTKEELLSLTETWKEPRSVQWHYVGTHEGYDYFHHRDLNTVMGYKVKVGEIEIEQRFDATSEESEWVLMPWGPGNKIKAESPASGNADKTID